MLRLFSSPIGRHMTLTVATVVVFSWMTPLAAAETAAVNSLFWCPSRTGQELQVKPAPGCQPLVEEKQDDKKQEKRTSKAAERLREFPAIKSELLEGAVSTYLKEYRDFLACCAAAPDIEEAAELETRASDLIKQVASQLSAASIYMSRNQALIVPVAQARDNLRVLQRQFGRILDSKDQLNELNYEQAGRERRKIQDMEDSLGREFSPKGMPSRAPSGSDIGGSGPTGPSVGASAPTGVGIGKGGPTGTAIGTPPPTLGELVDTAPGGERNRENSLTTTQPVSSGAVGPDIGNSSFNENARTGPSLGDSSQNR